MEAGRNIRSRPAQPQVRPEFDDRRPRPLLAKDRIGHGLVKPDEQHSSLCRNQETAAPVLANHQASIMSAIFSAVIKVGKLVSAQGNTGNSEASTTRNPVTPRTRP
jgi:hypothetical protein